jgi:hypothetical protein
MIFKKRDTEENTRALWKHETMFETPEGDAYWVDVIRIGIENLSGDSRYDLEKCCTARSKRGFDRHKNRILKRNADEARSIYTFFTNHWVTYDAITKEDKVKIAAYAKLFQHKLVQTYGPTHSYYDPR